MPSGIDWYYRDFNSAPEVRAMGGVDRDVYRSLLELIWEHGGWLESRAQADAELPFRDQVLSDKVWNLLTRGPGGRFTHPKMLRIVNWYKNKRNSGRAGGIASGEAKRKAKGQAKHIAKGEANGEGLPCSPASLLPRSHTEQGKKKGEDAEGLALAEAAPPPAGGEKIQNTPRLLVTPEKSPEEVAAEKTAACKQRLAELKRARGGAS